MIPQSPILDILRDHLSQIKSSGRDNVMSICPLPGHQETQGSFAINYVTGAWMCHGCGRSGGLPKLLRLLGFSSQTMDRLLEPLRYEIQQHKKKAARKQERRFLLKNLLVGDVLLPESLLGVYRWKPLDLVFQGFSVDLLKDLDIGYDKRKERITFPLRDTLGNLIGISGRSTRRGEHPKYKVYSRGHRGLDGEWIAGDFGPEFDATFSQYTVQTKRHLWNGHQVFARSEHTEEPEPLIIVEGYKACMWMLQHGFPNTVALMGSAMTLEQHDLISMMTSRAILFLDGDEAGRRGTEKIGKWLSRSVRVEVCSYDSPLITEPDALNKKGLIRALEARKGFTQWLTETRRGTQDD